MSERRRDLLAVEDLHLEIVNRGVVYRVLNGVNFTLKPGEVLGIVGESGCGKSLTCRCIIRLLPPGARVTAGRVWFDGMDLLTATEEEIARIRRRRIALIFQDPLTYLNPVLTIGSQILEVANPAGQGPEGGRSRSDLKAKCIRALGQAGLRDPQDIMERYPHELSGGMRQRAMIAMALVRDPDILVADEITTALDVTTQSQILDTLRSLRDETGMSIILVTHHMGVVAKACDRVAVMYAGSVVEVASVEELFSDPKHPYAEGLLGSLVRWDRQSISFIPGQVPNMRALPPGCSFHPRCPRATEACQHARPRLAPLNGDAQRKVACFLYQDPVSVGMDRGKERRARQLG